MRILVAEDDVKISAHVVSILSSAGFEVETATNGPDAWELGEAEDFRAILLDLGLPGMDGLSILKRWRQAGIKTPVIVLTARGSWMERVDGFDAGADDYLPKPFRQEELIARLRALLRRSSEQMQPSRYAGRFTIDDAVRRVTFDGKVIDVSPLEYRLISALVARKGQITTPLDLANQVQGRDDDTAKNAIEAMIGRLRRKTDPAAIETRRGFGYMLPDIAS